MSRTFFQVRRSLIVAAATFPVYGIPLSAAPVSWENDLREAIRASGRSDKPLLVEVTASWCHFCHRMFQETFTDERLARHIQHCFIPVRLDADVNRQLLDRLGVRGLPTTLLIGPDRKILQRITGFQTADQLESHLIRLCRHGRVQE